MPAAEHQAGGRCGLGHSGRTDQLRAAAPLSQRAGQLDRHLGGWPCPRLLVVGRLVDVDKGVEAGIECGQHRIGAQGGLIQPRDYALLKEQGQPQVLLRDQVLCGRRQRCAVGGGQRLWVATRHRQPDVGPVLQRAQDPPDEGGMQERQVSSADEGDPGPVSDGRQPGSQPLQRAQPFARVVNDVDARRQGRHSLTWRADHHDRPVGHPRDDANCPPQQG